MRDRHFPRLCGACHAPMARQEDACWACAKPWPVNDRRPAAAVSMAAPRLAPAEVDPSRLTQSDRSTNEGAGIGTQPAPAAVNL